MLTIQPMGTVLGATVRGLDLSGPVSEHDFGRLLIALSEYGVLHCPDMALGCMDDFKAFSLRFGDIQGSPIPGITCDRPRLWWRLDALSRPQTGRQIRRRGLCRTGLAHRHVLSRGHRLRKPALRYPNSPSRRQATGWHVEFANMHAAYDALPADLKLRLDGMTASHSYEKFWEHMRVNRGADRPPMTEELRRASPPVSLPLFLTHPISRRKVLYCNPGYTTRGSMNSRWRRADAS